MKAFLRKFTHNPLGHLLLNCWRRLKSFLKDVSAALHLIRWKRPSSRQLPIRVCFVQQDPNCWNKSKALYDLLKGDARFLVSLLCVPDPFDPDTSSTYRFFKENGYDCIDARIGEGPWDPMSNVGQWFDLSGLKPDYVFYQQPYNAYLPEAYRSHRVLRYARICHTPYGYVLIKELLDCMERDFCRHVYRTYSVSQLEKEYNQQQFPISHHLGLRKALYFSPLVLADFFSHREEESPSWAFSQNSFRAIWTPRWTTDEKLGGTNFFRYNRFLLEYAQAHPDTDILMRPHPMAFDNFVRTGQMTPEEVDRYIAACKSLPNTALDREKDYDATFWQGSVLISDLSAVIVEFFVTGKPVIFCETEKRSSTYVSSFQKILTACYVAGSSQELEQTLDRLRRGEDPLAQRRQEVIRELFGEAPTQAPERIRDDLVADYMK